MGQDAQRRAMAFAISLCVLLGAARHRPSDKRESRASRETGPALYLAKLFGSDDTEAIVRLITAVLVLVFDPLAVLLTLAV